LALADRQYGVVSRAREDAAMDRHEAAAPDPRRHAAVAKDVTGHPGAPKLVETLQRHEPGTTLTRSELEERFLALCRAAGSRRRCATTPSPTATPSTSTSPSPINGCWSRRTAGAGTAHESSSRPTAAATRPTRPTRPRAGARASPTTA